MNSVFELYYDHIPRPCTVNRDHTSILRVLYHAAHTRARANAYNVYDIHCRADERPLCVLYIS